MKCAEMIETETPAVARQDAVRMPNGMLGFEEIKDYVLTTNPEEQPFAWLQVQDNVALAFVVIDLFRPLREPNRHRDAGRHQHHRHVYADRGDQSHCRRA